MEYDVMVQRIADFFIGGGFVCETPEEEGMFLWAKEQVDAERRVKEI